MVGLITLRGAPTLAHDDCDTTVIANDSIQAAVDAASGGDVICLSGTFNQSVTIGTSDITLRSASTAILDGTGLPAGPPTSNHGITLAAGVSGVTIEGLEIRNYNGDGGGNDRSSAILAANGNTSNITVKDNYLHDNFWNGLLVFSNGVPANHTNWTVEENTVASNGFVNIELTNCDGCKVKENIVTGSSGFAGILIQARNTVASNPQVTVSNVVVEENEVSSVGRGIYLLALGSGPLPPFPAIVNGGALLQNVVVEDNEVEDAGITGIQVVAFGAGTVNQTTVEENEVEDSGTYGIRTTDFGSGATITSTVTLSENEASGSGTFDCLKEGTGNSSTWTDNEGETSSPAGLCGDDDGDDD